MRTTLQILLAITIIGLGLLAISVKPKTAHCSWCPSYTCYSSAMCGGCTCMKTGSNQGGTCVSLND